MFSSGPNYGKLKTSLRLAQQRLKLMEKKKTELAQKARKEIADYLAAGKVERAKIRVEHIIREDYLVEAMEVVEMYCDLILARFGLVTQMKDLDEGIQEAVASLIWVAPRLQGDILELKTVSDIFTQKYGKPFAESIINNSNPKIRASEKLQHKLEIHAPPKLLVEKYLIEIAKVFNVEYDADPHVMSQKEGTLIDLSLNTTVAPEPPGFVGFPTFPILPAPPTPFNYPFPPATGGSSISSSDKGPQSDFLNENNSKFKEAHDSLENDPNKEKSPPPPSYEEASNSIPVPFQPSQQNSSLKVFPDFPSIPADLPEIPQDDDQKKNDIDFDDLSRRFEALKKKK